ncbi:sugar ABC transporter substrate-binding protein [Aeromicrobium endophyticum]|uniref:Sugar ABC transporter substrate-binding protein n=1 Tax=Aeromicrobium endophyticum TaxID=2292704 RepID=A0A371PAM2_9ACTN|nr:sugar ABC transporter substrate-binding protein [Aeromicrobium endophyticum]REK72957.1 sugar ABC transporter substrate-binding protein [Aeromicrobium endophyticum]
MRGTQGRRWSAVVAGLALLVPLSACGSSDSGDGGGAGGSGSKDVGSKTIGWVDGTLAGSYQQRLYEAGKDAASHVGWKVKTVDTQGDPAKAASGVSSLVTSGVDAIIMSAVTPSTARAGLLQAKAKKIPVLMVGSSVDSSLNSDLDLTYIGEDEEALTKPLADLMLQNLKPGDQVGMLTTTALASAVERTDALTTALEDAGIEVVPPLETGFDFSAGQKNAATLLSQNPRMTAIVPIFDLWTAATLSALKSAKRDEVKVYSYYADAISTPLMRDNPDVVLGLADGDMISSPYVAIDKLLAFFADGKKITESDDDYEYVAVTKDSLPPGEQNGPVSQAEAAKPFFEKWAAEYDIAAS